MKIHNKVSWMVLAIAILLTGTVANANVRVAGIFGPHMVLQRNMPVPVWGWDKPGQTVTVTFNGNSVTATAGSTGRWMVKLPAMKADVQPQTLRIRGSSTVKINDVLIGEVWLCSGQSNMQYALNGSGHPQGGQYIKEVSKADYPLIRLMSVQAALASRPSDALRSRWLPCSPETVSSYSAVAYFFGRDLYHKLDVPVGLIKSAWGGTRIEPWTPKFAFQQTPELQNDFLRTQSAYARAEAAFIPLISTWLTQARAAVASHSVIPDLPPEPRILTSRSPTAIYNAMIHPLIPYAIRGAVWYQGESNVRDPLYYFRLKAMIESWRKLWRQGDFPFGIVQIAPFDYGGSPQYEAQTIWLAEEKAAQNVPDTGVIGTMDIGILHNLHPPDKRDIGYRLSLWALAKVYGMKSLVWSGPVYKSMAVDGNQVIIHFRHIGGGLVSSDGKSLNWFEIAGADHKFVPAQAHISGDTVVVRAANVAHPAVVEYGWDDRFIAESNLMNKAGLPAMPFNTDVSEAR